MTRQRVDAAVLKARAEANGYRRGAHEEQDRIVDDRRHNKKTQTNQNGTLHRYILWQLAYIELNHFQQGLKIPDEEEVRQQFLGQGVNLPDLATVKDFLRFYIATSQPRLVNKTTTDSMGTVAEWFFAGFTRMTGTAISCEVRTEIYQWQRRVLTAEGVLVNKRKPKHNFTVVDLVRLIITLWTRNDLRFIPERYRIQFTFILRVFCWTGARIGAFFTNGLRYRDIELVLQRTEGTAWKCFYRIDQRWVKNNRDPENIVFGTALQEHDKFIFDDVSFLLTMAFVDKALFGFDTLADLQEQQIPRGQDQLILRWNESVLDKPILRQCTKAGGVTDKSMPRSAFSQIFQDTLVNAGYFCAASVHGIRRQLGKKVDELYTEVQRSQHLTQADPRIFGQAYVANTSSVVGQGAFLGEASTHQHINYFQGLDRFREPGLPCELPARYEEELKRDQKLRELEVEVRQCPPECPTALKQSKQLLASYWKRLKRIALYEHREQWIQERRDHQILTRGREQSNDQDRTDLVQSLSLLFPERRRLACQPASDTTLGSKERWLVMEDLYTLCTRDLSVLYLPGHQPVGSCCPAIGCQSELDHLAKAKRNQHIQACTRQEIAHQRGYLLTDTNYCHLCFNWIVGLAEWEHHCQTHLDDLDSRRCGTVTYCHTLVRPAYCPFCLRYAKSATLRLKSWCRDHALWQHVDGHLKSRTWPIQCPHPLCHISLNDALDLRFHFIDEHGLSRTVPQTLKNLKTWVTVPSSTKHEQENHRKRKATGDNTELSWPQQKQLSSTHPPKKARQELLTIAPSLLSDLDASIKGSRSSIDLTASDFSIDTPEALSPRQAREDGPWGNEPEPGLQHQAQLQGSDNTLGDPVEADLFAQFIRSPSPDLVPTTVTPDGKGQTVVETDDLLTPASADVSNAGLLHHQSPSKESQDACGGINTKIRIRLRVKPLKKTIKLRLPVPCTVSQSKSKYESKPYKRKQGRRSKHLR